MNNHEKPLLGATVVPWRGVMPVRKVTQRAVSKLKPPANGSRIVWDGEVPGFGVRVTAASVVSFLLAYRMHGRQTKYTFGRAPEWSAVAARNEAIELRRRIREGIDPRAEQANARSERTVEALSREYIEDPAVLKLSPGTVRGYREMLRDIIVPRLGHLKLNSVCTRDVNSMHQWACDERRVDEKRTPYRANRALSLVSVMFNKAIEWKYCDSNPTKGVQRFPEDEREVWLTEEQLAAFDRAIDWYGREIGEALRLLILTGARKMEVLGAGWHEFDLDRGYWTKPTHHTKEKRIERLPISEAALFVLRRMKKKAVSPYLFPGAKPKAARVTIRRPWIQICRAAGLATEYKIQGKRGELTRYRPTVRIHDLRHTYASWLVDSGVPLKKVGKLIGHTQQRSTERYSHLADKSLRNATDNFGNSLKWVS